MNEFVQVARQPIIDANNATFGYELFNRDGESNAVNAALSDRAMSAQVMLSVFNLIGRERAVGDAIAFFNVTSDFLLTDIIEALPPDLCVFEIAADRPLRQNENAKIKYLCEKGYRFALDNFAVSDESIRLFAETLPFITFIKIDVQNSDVEFVATKTDALKMHHTLIAQKIETLAEFSAYHDMGFEYFQGYYIQHPQPVKHYRLEPRHFGVTRLYKMLDDVPFADFAKEFERHNELTIQFFQYLISCSFKQYDATQSVRDLVIDVGKEIMERWFMLLVYAKGSTEVKEERGSFSAFFRVRVDLMQTIVTNVHSADPRRRSDELRLLAIFSTLIDIYQIPFETLMQTFKVSKNLHLWIEDRKGRFTLIYKAVNQLQHQPIDVDKVNRVLKAFKTDYDEVSDRMDHII
jgi:c-di-GMP phosphodiesterase